MTANHTKLINHEWWLLFNEKSGKALSFDYGMQVLAVFPDEASAWKYLYTRLPLDKQEYLKPLKMDVMIDIPVLPKEEKEEIDSATYQEGRLIDL